MQNIGPKNKNILFNLLFEQSNFLSKKFIIIINLVTLKIILPV